MYVHVYKYTFQLKIFLHHVEYHYFPKHWCIAHQYGGLINVEWIIRLHYYARLFFWQEYSVSITAARWGIHTTAPTPTCVHTTNISIEYSRYLMRAQFINLPERLVYSTPARQEEISRLF